MHSYFFFLLININNHTPPSRAKPKPMQDILQDTQVKKPSKHVVVLSYLAPLKKIESDADIFPLPSGWRGHQPSSAQPPYHCNDQNGSTALESSLKTRGGRRKMHAELNVNVVVVSPQPAHTRIPKDRKTDTWKIQKLFFMKAIWFFPEL